jgi:hypothetical protein
MVHERLGSGPNESLVGRIFVEGGLSGISGAIEIVRRKAGGDFNGEQLGLVRARNGAAMNFIEDFEGPIGHPSDDIELRQIESSRKGLGLENSDALKLIGGLAIK